MTVEPFTLEDKHVRLVPLTPAHAPALAEVGLDPAIWTWFPARPTTAGQLTTWIGTICDMRTVGHIPFATFDKAARRFVGSTSYGNVAFDHRRAEIGWTWLAPASQRTAVNTAAKLLMLGHAFDSWKLRRVEFKTDARNEKSRAALLRLGAVEEGALRKHMVLADGSPRDSVYYSITDDEWPAVRARLEARLARR